MRDRKYLTTSEGETDSLDGWSARTGIKKTTISARRRRGYTVDESLELKPRASASNRTAVIEFTYNGETLSASDIAERLGITRGAVLTRHYSGWTIEEIMSGKRTAPAGKGGRNPVMDIEWNGRSYSRKDFAEMIGISYVSLNTMVRAGHSGKSIIDRVKGKKETKRKKPNWSSDDLYSVSNLSYHTGIPEEKIEDLIDRGLSGKDIIEPSDDIFRKLHIKYKGRNLNLEDWSKETNIPAVMLYRRLDDGWTDAQILGYEPPP